MDIDEFYDGDQRRRPSDELQLGDDWHDSHGRRYELNWVADTGEVYVMQDDPPPVWSDPFGDIVGLSVATDDLGVRVLTVVDDRADLLRRLDGWEEAMALPDGVAWLVEHLFRPPPAEPTTY